LLCSAAEGEPAGKLADTDVRDLLLRLGGVLAWSSALRAE
jgi:hypothetical protein